MVKSLEEKILETKEEANKKKEKEIKEESKKEVKVFSIQCKLCKKLLTIVCKGKKHLILNEKRKRNKVLEFSKGFDKCPHCGKFFLLRHREDKLHSISY